MFIAVLFTTAPAHGNDLNGHGMDKEDVIMYIYAHAHTTEYYSATKQ